MATRQRPGLTKQHAVTNLADQLGKSSDATPVAPASDVAPRQRPGMSKQNGEINIVSGDWTSSAERRYCRRLFPVQLAAKTS
jgi:hypothetical protein